MSAKTNAVQQPSIQPTVQSDADKAKLAVKDLAARSVEGVDLSGNKVSVNVSDPQVWQAWGAEDSGREKTDVAHWMRRLAYVRALLEGAEYHVWIAFRTLYIAGAEADGYSQPADLYQRRVLNPLTVAGIKRPESPTSSNARVVSDDVKKAAEIKAAAEKTKAEAMAKLSDADIAAEIAAGKGDKARMAELGREFSARNAASVKADEKAAKEQRTAALKSVNDAVKLLDAMQLVSLHGFAVALLQHKDNATAIPQYCAKVLSAYENAMKPKASKKPKA